MLIFIARYADIDLALDTFPYSGGLTTYEALWMGVPVVAKNGATFASRHALGILQAVGLPELVGGDGSEYLDKAVSLATNWDRLASMRDGLRIQWRRHRSATMRVLPRISPILCARYGASIALMLSRDAEDPRCFLIDL